MSQPRSPRSLFAAAAAALAPARDITHLLSPAVRAAIKASTRGLGPGQHTDHPLPACPSIKTITGEEFDELMLAAGNGAPPSKSEGSVSMTKAHYDELKAAAALRVN